MAFQMCQSCDKSCLNFTQSEIKCQQKLAKLSDQVRQTTNRKKINQMWKVAKRGENAYLCDSHRSQGYLTCFPPAADAPPCSYKLARRTPEAVVLSWLGHEQSKNSAAPAEDAGRRLAMVGWKETEGLGPRARAGNGGAKRDGGTRPQGQSFGQGGGQSCKDEWKVTSRSGTPHRLKEIGLRGWDSWAKNLCVNCWIPLMTVL